MFYLKYTDKWLSSIIYKMHENNFEPKNSRFMLAIFSSMDTEFVKYFRENKKQISSVSGDYFHIFTPFIDEDNCIPDSSWRSIIEEFKQRGIPIKIFPTFVFFDLISKSEKYEPYFFAGYEVKTFENFPYKLRASINSCIDEKNNERLVENLTEIFESMSIVNPDSTSLKQLTYKPIYTSKIFISHSSKDKIFVNKLVSELSDDTDIKFWIDDREILAGDDIQKSISNNMKSSDMLFLIISDNSVNSDWVRLEVAQYMFAHSNNNIIPIYISSKPRFPEPIDNLLRKLKYLDFSNEKEWDKNIEQLKVRIERDKNFINNKENLNDSRVILKNPGDVSNKKIIDKLDELVNIQSHRDKLTVRPKFINGGYGSSTGRLYFKLKNIGAKSTDVYLRINNSENLVLSPSNQKFSLVEKDKKIEFDFKDLSKDLAMLKRVDCDVIFMDLLDNKYYQNIVFQREGTNFKFEIGNPKEENT